MEDNKELEIIEFPEKYKSLIEKAKKVTHNFKEVSEIDKFNQMSEFNFLYSKIKKGTNFQITKWLHCIALRCNVLKGIVTRCSE